MAVEEDRGRGVEVLEEGEAGAELVDDEGGGLEGLELGGEVDVD